MPAGSVQRPDQLAIDANHETRIRALERSPGDGIRFNVDNEGGWLFVVANDSTDLGYGEEGIVLVDLSGKGIFIQTGGELKLNGSPVTVNGNAVGTITNVTSGDGSIDVTDGSGPSTDLAVAVVDGGSP